MTKPQGYTQAGRELVRQQATTDSGRQALEHHQQFLRARQDQLARWVTGGLRPEALIRFALLDLQQQPKLRECDPASIYLALLACAQTGLEPGALKGEAYLVPFARRAQFMAGYKGLIKMARRSREVRGISAEIVRANDLFELELGSEPRIRHRPLIGDRGDVIGAYAVAHLAHGQRELEWMDAHDLDKIRNIAEARGKSPAWREWPGEMQRKSAIRRLCKRLPLGQDYFVATAIDQGNEDGDTNSVRTIVDVLTDGEAMRAEQAQTATASMRPPGYAADTIDAEEAAEIARLEAEEAARG